MCGIVAVLGSQDTSATRRIQIVDCARKLRHRGPDWSGIHHSGNNFLAHERLAIIDPASGDQPLYSEDKSIVVTVNGEIYNHEELKKGLTGKHTYRTGSDCEVIPHLYEEVGEDVASLLDGMFSFVLLDNKTGNFMAARDPIGITPLYMGWGRDGSVWFASEMKALTVECDQFQEFPPGHIYSSKQGGLRRYYNPPWFDEHIPSGPLDLTALRVAFEKAVIKRLMTDVPFGVLLSGGLDSSLVASVASRHLAETKAAVWGPKLHTFSVGLPGSPDLKAAREVADILKTDHHELTFSVQRPKLRTFSVGFPGSSDLKAAREVAAILGTEHHEFTFSLQDGLDALSEVIYHIETYDVTTIRASTPMFLMSRKIRAIGVKMVLSGEGSDEIFGGYLYFHKAPNKEEFHKETCRKIKALHMYDCLRANKSTSAWGIEARVPFLDKEFIDVAMAIDPQYKMAQKFKGKPIEKFIIRKAFDTPENPFLPEHILYRQKEQFSDGVGYSWIDGLKDFAEKQVTDQQMQHAEKAFPVNSPTTKEGYYYRTLFEKHFPQHAAALTVPGGPSVACSTAAAIEWDKAWANMLDPSGRAATGVHDSAYEPEAKTAANGV